MACCLRPAPCFGTVLRLAQRPCASAAPAAAVAATFVHAARPASNGLPPRNGGGAAPSSQRQRRPGLLQSAAVTVAAAQRRPVQPAKAQQHGQIPSPAALLSRSSLLRGAGVLVLGSGGALLEWSPPARGTSSVAVAAMSTSAEGALASPTGAIVVYVTVPSAEVGETLGSKLVESKLAACVNVLPGLTSIYSWKGKIEKDSELLLIIKSRQELLAELTAFVRANHPYEEPEVIALPVLGGSPSYLQWLMDNTRQAGAA